jgi:hypothetical protein
MTPFLRVQHFRTCRQHASIFSSSSDDSAAGIGGLFAGLLMRRTPSILKLLAQVAFHFR